MQYWPLSHGHTDTLDADSPGKSPAASSCCAARPGRYEAMELEILENCLQFVLVLCWSDSHCMKMSFESGQGSPLLTASEPGRGCIEAEPLVTQAETEPAQRHSVTRPRMFVDLHLASTRNTPARTWMVRFEYGRGRTLAPPRRMRQGRCPP
jgi:hypothetical protein